MHADENLDFLYQPEVGSAAVVGPAAARTEYEGL